MKLNRLPVFYQNADVIDAEERERTKSPDTRNYLDIPFYQTKLHRPEIYYKPVSKIWTLNEE